MVAEKVQKEKTTPKNNYFTRGKEDNGKEIKCKCKRSKGSNAGGGAVYGMGLIGALIYFFQHLGVATANNIFWAIVHSIIWPGLLVYKVLELLKF